MTAEQLDLEAAPYVGRLHAAVTGRASTVDLFHVAEAVVLTLDDAQALLDLIADLCPDHQACEACGAAACERCGVGGFEGWCLHQGFWCADCRYGMCRDCRADLS